VLDARHIARMRAVQGAARMRVRIERMQFAGSSICAPSAAYSACVPSHQWMRAGWVRRATSSTH